VVQAQQLLPEAAPVQREVVVAAAREVALPWEWQWTQKRQAQELSLAKEAPLEGSLAQ